MTIGIRAAFVLCLITFTSADILLSDSSYIKGFILSEDDSTITIDSPSLGEITLPKTRVLSKWYVPNRQPEKPVRISRRLREEAYLESLGDPGAWDFSDPNDNALAVMPTAFQPAERNVIYKDFEVLALTLSYSPTKYTTIAGGTALPFLSEQTVNTLGFKQTIYLNRDKTFAAAVAATTFLPGDSLTATYTWGSLLILSFRPGSAFGIHFAIGPTGREVKYDNDDVVKSPGYEYESGTAFFVGFETSLSESSKLILEVFDPQKLFPDPPERIRPGSYCHQIFWEKNFRRYWHRNQPGYRITAIYPRRRRRNAAIIYPKNGLPINLTLVIEIKREIGPCHPKIKIVFPYRLVRGIVNFKIVILIKVCNQYAQPKLSAQAEAFTQKIFRAIPHVKPEKARRLIDFLLHKVLRNPFGRGEINPGNGHKNRTIEVSHKGFLPQQVFDPRLRHIDMDGGTVEGRIIGLFFPQKTLKTT